MRFARSLFISMLMFLWCRGYSQSVTADSLLSRVMEDKSLYLEMVSEHYQHNPALESVRRTSSLSDIHVGWKRTASAEAIEIQQGAGQRGFEIDAKSYLRLNNSSVVWGHVGYQNGIREKVKWCDAIDYRLLAPYVMGDSVGGNLASQQYDFAGGYAVSAHRWHLGASVAYRAESAWRNVDPRLKIVVSDFRLLMGATYRLVEDYDVGISAGINVHNQECDLEFFNPINDINTYALTGLGTCYSRFSGTACKDASYKFVGFKSGLQLNPVGESGLIANVVFDYYEVKQILRELNNLTLGTVASYNFAGLAGRQWRVGPFMWSVVAEGNWQRRIATENLFGKPMGNTYEVIASRSFFYCDYVDARITLAMEYSPKANQILSLAPFIRFDYGRENYRQPSREIEWRRRSMGLEMAYAGPISNSWLAECRLWGSITYGRNMKERLVDLPVDLSLSDMVLSDFYHNVSNRRAAGCRFEIGRMMSPSILTYLTISGGICHFSGNIPGAFTISGAVGLKF